MVELGEEGIHLLGKVQVDQNEQGYLLHILSQSEEEESVALHYRSEQREDEDQNDEGSYCVAVSLTLDREDAVPELVLISFVLAVAHPTDWEPILASPWLAESAGVVIVKVAGITGVEA